MRTSGGSSRLAILAGLLGLAAPACANLSPDAEAALEQGLHHLYDLDYDQSRADFRKVIEKEPDNPFGYLFEAGGIWWQSSQEYGLFDDTPTLQGLFEEDVEAAIRKSGPWTNSKDRSVRADGHFALGMALGTRGQWSLLRRRWVKAYFDGKKAIHHLKKAMKIDPQYYDADLGLGVFDYQAAHMSGVLKISAMIGGVRADEPRGLDEIGLAMERGRYSARQAAEFLATIYIADKKNYAKGLEYVQRLRQAFPESVYFAFLELALRQSLSDWDGSLKDGRELFEKAKANPPAFNRKLLSLLCGMEGPDCLGRSDAAIALIWLSHAVEATPEPRPRPRAKRRGRRARREPTPEEAEALQWLSWLHLWRGCARDLLGQREEARGDYAWVLAHPDFAGGQARARELSEESLTRQALIAYLRALSRGEPWPEPEPRDATTP